MMKKLLFPFFIVIISHSLLAVADPSLNLDEIAEISRNRLYPGGVDEEDLKVLKKLPLAIKKIDKKSFQKQVYKSIFKAQEEESSSDQSLSDKKKKQ